MRKRSLPYSLTVRITKATQKRILACVAAMKDIDDAVTPSRFIDSSAQLLAEIITQRGQHPHTVLGTTVCITNLEYNYKIETGTYMHPAMTPSDKLITTEETYRLTPEGCFAFLSISRGSHINASELVCRMALIMCAMFLNNAYGRHIGLAERKKLEYHIPCSLKIDTQEPHSYDE